MIIPGSRGGVIKAAIRLMEDCSVSIANRSTAYRNYSQFIETGRGSGGLSLANMMFSHVDRTSSHLFCPTDARFTIDFENLYPKSVLAQGDAAARTLTKAFNRHNFDLRYSSGVFQSLAYGAAIIKITGSTEQFEYGGKRMTRIKKASGRIVPPWLMGVINEGRNGFEDQEAIMEKVFLSKDDVWRRIAHLPDAETMFKRIISHGDKTGGPSLPASFIQVLSTSTLNIAPQGSNPPSPGGIIQMTGDPNYSTVGPQVSQEMYCMNEFWVWDDARSDWLMIQYIEPDILIAPLYKRSNEFCEDCIPYILVQPNEVPGYFWGRSEIVDLTALQAALSETADDFRRLIGLQYDGRYAFEGFNGDPQELYDDMRSAGYLNGPTGAKVNNLTPKLDPACIEYLKWIEGTMQTVSGFGNILQGQGESGVRAGVHANTLLKTASPRLRDRSLIVERQYAAFGDRYLSYLEAKDETPKYTDPDKPEETSFLLDQLPDDRHVQVDSHSSSPIYENDHNQLAAFGLKTGIIGGDDAIEMLNFPNRDELKRKFREKQAAERQFLEQHPELLTKARGTKK